MADAAAAEGEVKVVKTSTRKVRGKKMEEGTERERLISYYQEDEKLSSFSFHVESDDDSFFCFVYTTKQYKIVKADIPEDLLAKAIVRTNEAMDKYQIEKVCVHFSVYTCVFRC